MSSIARSRGGHIPTAAGFQVRLGTARLAAACCQRSTARGGESGEAGGRHSRMSGSSWRGPRSSSSWRGAPSGGPAIARIDSPRAFELLINRKTAANLGIKIPQTRAMSCRCSRRTLSRARRCSRAAQSITDFPGAGRKSTGPFGTSARRRGETSRPRRGDQKHRPNDSKDADKRQQGQGDRLEPASPRIVRAEPPGDKRYLRACA